MATPTDGRRGLLLVAAAMLDDVSLYDAVMQVLLLYLIYSRAAWGGQLYLCHHFLVQAVGILLVVVSALHANVTDMRAPAWKHWCSMEISAWSGNCWAMYNLPGAEAFEVAAGQVEAVSHMTLTLHQNLCPASIYGQSI